MSARIGLVVGPGASRREIIRTLNAAYADGLLSEETFAHRLDQVLKDRLIDPRRLIGDLTVGAPTRGLRARLSAAMNTLIGQLEGVFANSGNARWTLLALDWSGDRPELLIGRHHACDVVLSDLSVSRRHARLSFRGGRWVLQDLASTNGTRLNGVRIGRCELRPGDRLLLGDQELLVD